MVRPAALELAAPRLEVHAGATAELKGKVVRMGLFKGSVLVSIKGFPAGLKADPVTVAPDQVDFTLKVVADSKAVATSVSATLAPAFQINKKDYPTPPTPLAIKVLPAP
jgi:hypothetical protein